MADIVGGGTPNTSISEFWDGDIDWYAPAEIADQIYLTSSQRKITEQGYNHSSTKMLPVGTVLFTSRAGIGKTAILSRKGCTNQGFQSIIPHKGELDSYFIFSRTEELKRYGENVGAGSTFVEVSGKQMANMELMMPTTLLEQKAIGQYFANLDNLITLHQYKCLAKHCCFPSKITHPWEQRKLGEIAPLRGGFAFSSNEYCDGGIPIVRISNILSNGSVGGEFVYFKEQENDDLYSLVTGDILLAMSGATTGKVAMIKTEKPYKYYQNQRVGHFTKAKETDYLFVATIVSSDRFTEQLRNVLVAGAQPNVSSKDIDSFEFYVPKAKDEQREIGLYFNHLENLITLHQRNAKKEVLLLVNKAIPLIINSYHLALFAILIISSSATTSGSYSKTKLASGL